MLTMYLSYFDRLEKINENLNTKHTNIKFTKEKEFNESLSFLDVLLLFYYNSLS